MNQGGYAELKAAVGESRPAAFVLGSGLGPVVARMKQLLSVGFAEIPGMVAPSVAGHGGSLIFGEWTGRPVLVLLGISPLAGDAD